MYIISTMCNSLSFNHLDANNLKQIQKLYYLKQKNYSPYRNIFYLKYKNMSMDTPPLSPSTKINMTELLQQLTQQYNQLGEDTSTEVEDENNESYTKSLHKYGQLDSMGVFRYYKPGTTEFPTPSYAHSSSSSTDTSNHLFEIIRYSQYNFSDVGGYEKIKKELMQCADMLIHYEKYKQYNVRTPKGIIFEGPPGNGKTLIAKGFSGEINVSFIPVSGSEFSEKYVGVGASRIRELFQLAEKNRPCIIFIDEIDAVARKRGNDMVSSNSEKDQTLNQLLINLDGYKSVNGIFVIGATNRIDLLDPALIRPGRIDKNIYIGNPDSQTREHIIQIHLKGKPIEPSISLSYMVEITSGFSCAQIENLLNEAMLNALRENREMILLSDIEFIGNRIIAGWQATENKYSDDIINRIVIHELGHAIIGFFSHDHSNLVKVILNLWSPKTPGYTIFENNDENANIYTKDGLISHLMVLLGGRIAEEIFYGYSVTTGAKKDLEEAYRLAQNMILHYGMGKKNIYPDMSDHSKYLIDQEVNALIIEANDNANRILKNAKELIIDCSVLLKQKNMLKPDDIIEIIDSKYPNMWNLYDIKNNYK